MNHEKKIIGVDYGSKVWHMSDGEHYQQAATDRLLETATRTFGGDIILVIEFTHSVPRKAGSENLSQPWTPEDREEFIAKADSLGIEVRTSSQSQTSKFRRDYYPGDSKKGDENDCRAVALAMRDDKNFRHLQVMRPGYDVNGRDAESEYVFRVGRNIEYVKKSDSKYKDSRCSSKVRDGQDYVLELAHYWRENTSLRDECLSIHHGKDDVPLLSDDEDCGDSLKLGSCDIKDYLRRLCIRKLLWQKSRKKEIVECSSGHLTLPLCVAAAVIDPVSGERMKIGGVVPGARKINDTCFSNSDTHGLRGVARSGKQHWFQREIINNQLPKSCGYKKKNEKPHELFKKVAYADGDGLRLKDEFLQPLNCVTRRLTRNIISEMIKMQEIVGETELERRELEAPVIEGWLNLE